MSSLPPEIIINILIRLPVKSLLRFRSVSTPWCAQIDGTDFINLHLNHSLTTGSNHFPITESDSEGALYSLDSDSLENLEKIETPFVNMSDHPLYNTCNGLLLFKTKSFILFNPSTRKHRVLPTPPPLNKYPSVVPVRRVRSSDCLGYDVINNDYKVFNFVVLGYYDFTFVTCEARIYSLKSNSWHIVKDFTKGMILGNDFEAYVNGALHTVNDEDTAIFALDVCNEAINLIPLPNIGDNNVSHCIAHVFDGCLAVVCRYPEDNRTDVWVMKDYGVKESWSMFLSVKHEIPCLYVRPMVYSKSRTEILLSCYRDKLVWYDLTKKTVRCFKVSGLAVKFGNMVCVESLVRVVGPGKIDEQKKQHGEEKLNKEIGKRKRWTQLDKKA